MCVSTCDRSAWGSEHHSSVHMYKIVWPFFRNEVAERKCDETKKWQNWSHKRSQGICPILDITSKIQTMVKQPRWIVAQADFPSVFPSDRSNGSLLLIPRLC